MIQRFYNVTINGRTFYNILAISEQDAIRKCKEWINKEQEDISQ